MGVKGDGEETVEDAYLSSVSNLEIDINGWTLDSDGNVQYDGENMLVIPTSMVTLFPEGETRVYNVYAVSETEVLQMTDNLPTGITAGFVRNSDYVYTLTIKAEAGSVDRAGTLSFTLGSLTAQIRITQAQYKTPAYLDLDADELITFSSLKGETSGAITVTSSGSWVATIYNGTNFSFESGNSQVTHIEGEPGGTFTIYTILENQSQEVQPSFVIVKLKDNPDVSRAIMLEQKVVEAYIRFNPGNSMQVNTAGGTISNLKLESNGTWEAEIISSDGRTGVFVINGNEQDTLSGTGDNSSVSVKIPAYYGNKVVEFVLKAWIVDLPEIYTEQIFYQQSYYVGELFITIDTGTSNLVDPTSANYTLFGYNLGEGMRNTSLFGPGGSLVDMPYGGFTFEQTKEVDYMREARIIQMVSISTNTTAFRNAYAEHQADPSKFLLFSGNSQAVPNALLSAFQKNKGGLGYGMVNTVENEVENYRGVYQKENNLEHPLMQYLLDGPAGKADPDEILLQSGNNWHSGGLKDKDWPSTFVPIIKSTNSYSNLTGEYCVFGIDPVHRIILIMDPSIFGSISNPGKLSTYPNQLNYADGESANSIFLNNFIAWMANLAVHGEDFLQQFQR